MKTFKTNEFSTNKSKEFLKDVLQKEEKKRFQKSGLK